MKKMAEIKNVTGVDISHCFRKNNTLVSSAVLTVALLFSGLSLAQTSISVTFKVDMTGVDSQDGAYITGSFTGPEGQWNIVPMTDEGNGIYSYETDLGSGEEGAYYFLQGNDWDLRERVPAACALMWNVDRKYSIPDSDITYSFKYGFCEQTGSE